MSRRSCPGGKCSQDGQTPAGTRRKWRPPAAAAVLDTVMQDFLKTSTQTLLFNGGGAYGRKGEVASAFSFPTNGGAWPNISDVIHAAQRANVSVRLLLLDRDINASAMSHFRRFRERLPGGWAQEFATQRSCRLHLQDVPFKIGNK